MSISYAQLAHFSRQFRAHYDRQFGPFLEQWDLSMREVHVLLFLINNPELDTARDVVIYRGLSKSQVSQAVEVLCRRGILTRSADTEDRRVVHLAITDQGMPLAREAQRQQALCGQRLLMGLAPREQQDFLRLLEKVLENTDILTEGSTDREP